MHESGPSANLLSSRSHPGVVEEAIRLIRWVRTTHRDGMCVTSSFGDAVLAHLAHLAVPGIEITLLDTGYLFAETEWYADDLADRFGLNLRVMRAAADSEPNRWQTDADGCCGQRKVATLERALAGRTAWVTGLRRSDSPSRRETPAVHADPSREVIKVNPLAAWSDETVAFYSATYRLPEHPLADRGYASIGCWPCTRPADDPKDPRSGRWAGSEKTECGLHLGHVGHAGDLRHHSEVPVTIGRVS